MKVEDVMTKEIITVDKDQDLKHVLTLMEKHDITKIPVLEEKKIVGVITDNVIAYKLGSIRNKGIPASRMHASSVVDDKFEKTEPETELKNILTKVGEPGPTMINVIKNDELLGVVTKADLLPYVDSKEKIRAIMKKDVHTVNTDDRVVHARRIMIDNDIARIPVKFDGELVGMISDMDIAFAFADLKDSVSLGKQKHHLDKLLVENAMKTPALYISPDTAIKKASEIMLENNVGCLPVVDSGKIVGIVTRTDLIKTISSF
jgi:CBS domain-containing protein